jgi:catechol 2,3-dioxygenase-like lactoylglutathione lyase family enzyme
MKANLGHLQINVDPRNQAFYSDLFKFLEWQVLYQDEQILGVGDAHQCGLWFVQGLKADANDYDGIGMNHLAVAVANQTDVDAVVDYLKAHDVEALFNTPCHRPEFSEGPDETYYQVMFRSPDNILFEVVYTGPKGK